MRVLAFVTDAYGGHGGVAKVNRDLFDAWMAHPAIDAMTVIPRAGGEPNVEIPPAISYRAEAAHGASSFLRETGRIIAKGDYDGVFTGHIHLAPFAALAAKRAGVPWVLLLHGIEAWGPPHWPATQGALATKVTLRAARTADTFVTVSDVTRQRYAQRVGLRPEDGIVVPNSVDASSYGEGTKRDDLLARYGLANRTTLMTLARLDPGERYKGVDEVMEALPTLAETHPDVAYLICGSGADRERLEAKADVLGVADRVVFAGYVPEEEKADHYRLADAFVMPGWGEGFGIVYLEALACGVPAVASSLDASHEAVRDGELGVVVDPKDPASVVEGIRDALARPKGIPDGLAYFSQERFAERWRAVAEHTFRLPTAPPSP
ncbi:MAG: hypothetical protein Rubg2KO_27390 [Rubricoccaceae bacterium]